MKTKKIALLGSLVGLLAAGSASALEISSPVSNLSNLWYYSQVDDAFGFSPATGDYRDGGQSSVAWDYWDHQGVAPSMISGADFISGETLTLNISGVVQPEAGSPSFDADGQTTMPDHLGLTLSSVVGVWATGSIAPDGSFTALDLDPGVGTLFDFQVGSSFSQVIPDNAVALFLGYNSTVDQYNSILAADNGATLQDFFTVSASVTTPVPLPAGIWLLLSGLAALGGKRYMARKA